MSLFPITHYRSFNDPFDRFFGDQLHLFDPWHDFDTFPTSLSMRPSSFRWINEPRRFGNSTSSSSSYRSSSSSTGSSSNTIIPVTTNSMIRPAQSEKFRVQLNVAGFNPDTIKTRVEGRQVIVEARQEDRQGIGDYNIRELRKTYELPDYADTFNLASFVTPDNMLVIEVPVNTPRLEYRSSQGLSGANALAQFGQYRDPIFDYNGFITSSDFRPRLLDTYTGHKQLKMALPLKNYRPEQIKISIKNNELIVQAEHVYADNHRSERSYFTKSITLPPGTQADQVRSFLNSYGELEIEAPFIEPNQTRSIDVQRRF